MIIRKQRASAFFGTPLVAHLNMLGIRTIVMCGESTSGCVRASCVDAFSYGLNVVLVEECCFDRALISHKINLFDMHHKYADVVDVDVVVKHLDGMKCGQVSDASARSNYGDLVMDGSPSPGADIWSRCRKGPSTASFNHLVSGEK